MDVLGSENVRLGFYFADLIFVVCLSTAKTAKIGSIEKIRLYGMLSILLFYSYRCKSLVEEKLFLKYNYIWIVQDIQFLSSLSTLFGFYSRASEQRTL